MRTSPILALLLVGALIPATASAASEPIVTDAADDVECVAVALDMPLPGAPCNGVEFIRGNDLRALTIAETADDLLFSVIVGSMQGSPQGTAAVVNVDWNSKSYQVSMGYFTGDLSTAEGNSYAYLLVEEGGEWDYVAELPEPVVARDAATITASVPKVYFLDAQKRIPGLGDAIGITQVTSDPNFIGLGIAEARLHDAMPDEPGSEPYTLTMGDVAQGDITLIAPERVRVSNGGATTFVFQVEIKNPGEAEHEYSLAAADLPEGWNATVQGSVKVASKESKTVSILLSVPFAHDHGGYSAFNFTAQSVRDAGTNARLRLGVLHTPIPQPAGHHSELYLHAQSGNAGPLGAPFAATFPYAWGWMNTQSDHTDDFEYMTPSENGIFLRTDEATYWWINLNPNLLVGLDFDIDRLGAVEGAILGGRSGESEVRADLFYWADTGSGGESILLAEGDAMPITLDPQSPAPFSITLSPTAESDYIAYTPEAYMVLQISIPADITEGVTPPLRPRLMVDPFKLSLPLNEYHDRLTGATEAANAISVTAKGLVEKIGQPGTVLTYTFDVKNPGSADTFIVELAGNDIQHATVVPHGVVTLGSNEAREVTVAVEIPIDANPGEEFEVLLFVHSRDDPSKMAIARTKTRATDVAGEAMADESATLLAAQARENKTPGAGFVLVVGALCIAFLASFRRR